MDPLVLVLAAFIATSLAAGISESRFYNALANAGTIASDTEVLRRFSEDPRGMPRTNVRETRSRLRELVTRQPDSEIERLRKLALTWSVISGVVFLGFVVAMSRPA